MPLDKAYQVVIGGKDYTEFVQNITNQFILNEPSGTSSTISLKADTAEGNITLLREIIQHCNKQAPAKVKTRGYYSNQLSLRLAGYCVQMNGQNPFTGVTVAISATRPSDDNPDEENQQSEPLVDYTVTEIVKKTIKDWGYTEGKIDNFDITIGQWLPGNRTFSEIMNTLGDYVGAITSIDLAPVRIDGTGSIKLDGIFEDSLVREYNDSNSGTGEPIAVEDLSKSIEENADPNANKASIIRLIKPTTGDDVPANELSTGTRADNSVIWRGNENEPGSLVPLPTGAKMKTGPGQGAVDPNKQAEGNGFYYSPDSQFKTEVQRRAEEDFKKNFDPYLINKITQDGAKIYSFVNPTDGKVTQYVGIVDNYGRKITVPLDVALATAKSRKVVNFVKGDESQGMLGPSGLILTLHPGESKFPLFRVKGINGFEYLPQTDKTENVLMSAGLEGINGASKRDFKAREITIPKGDQSTIEALAQRPEFKGAFRKITHNGQDYYIAYDPTVLRVDKKTGSYLPTQSELNQKDQNGVAVGTRAMTIEEFNSISPSIVHDMYMKRRAGVYNDSREKFLSMFYPQFDMRIAEINKLNPDNDNSDLNRELQEIERKKEDVLDKEERENPYIDSEENAAKYKDDDLRNKTMADSGDTILPIFTAKERLVDLLPTVKNTEGVYNAAGEQYSLTVGGTSLGSVDDVEQFRRDGKAPIFKANTIFFSPSTGASVRADGATGAENMDRDNWPFSMKIEIDSAIELSTGLIINCDGSFGPFMGPYTIHAITESISTSGLSMELDLQTQAYLNGYGRQINSRQQDSNIRDGEIATQEDLKRVENLPRPVGNAAGVSIVEMARIGLNASWSASKPGSCSAYVRAVVEHKYGVRSTISSGGHFSGIFGGSAKITGQNARAAGIMSPYTGKNSLRAGDIIVIETGSGGYGHIGIYGGDGYVYENSWRHGENAPDGRYKTPANVFLSETPTGIIRVEDMDKWARAHGGK